MSASNEASSSGIVPIVICSTCHKSLVSDINEDINIVNTVCGHVFHETCLKNFYKGDQKRNRDSQLYRCPVCRCKTTKDISKRLFLQTELDQNTIAIIENNKIISKQNAELKKQNNVSEIKLMLLLEPKTKILPRKLSEITWNDITIEFQEELLKKIETRLNGLNIHNLSNLSFLRPYTLFQIIQSEANDRLILLNISDDYFDKSLSGNVYVTLDNVKHFFRDDFIERVRVASNVPLLDLSQIPVSRTILKILMTKEHDLQSGNHNKNMIAKLAETHLMSLSRHHVNQLYKVRLIQLISTRLDSSVELQIPYVDKNILHHLQRKGFLKKINGQFEFAHDLIKHYITGIMVVLIVRHIKMTIANSKEYILDECVADTSLEEYCVNYLFNANEKNNIDAFRYSEYFNQLDTENMKLMLILAIMKINNPDELIVTLDMFKLYFNYACDIQYPCYIHGCIKHLSLLHFAALRGNVVIMERLYNWIAVREYTTFIDFADLIHLSCSGTLSCTDDEINERKKMISLLISLKRKHVKVSRYRPMNTPKTVNFSLIKYTIDLDCFKEIWNIEMMPYECSQFISHTKLRNLLSCVSKPQEWKKIVEYYCGIDTE